MRDNFSQLFLRVSSLSRPPQRLLYAEFFFESRRRRGISMHLFMSVLVFMLGAPMAPCGSQAWTPQPPFVILMSHYIFVWAWASETRSVKHVVTPVLLEFHPPVGLTHVTVGFVSIEKISVDSVVSIRSAHFVLFSFFYLFNKKTDLSLPLPFSEFYSFTIYSSNPKYFTGKCFVPMDVYNKF